VPFLQQSWDSVLRQQSFTKFWFSRILSSTSFQMLSVAIGWQMYALTHDAFSLGFVGLAQFAPMVLLTFVVGHVADRFDRRKIVFLCQLVEGGIAALLLLGNLAGWLDKFCWRQRFSELAVLSKAPPLLPYCHNWSRKLSFSKPSHGVLRPDKRPKSWVHPWVGCFFRWDLISFTLQPL
jgi:MFS family permease